MSKELPTQQQNPEAKSLSPHDEASLDVYHAQEALREAIKNGTINEEVMHKLGSATDHLVDVIASSK